MIPLTQLPLFSIENHSREHHHGSSYRRVTVNHHLPPTLSPGSETRYLRPSASFPKQKLNQVIENGFSVIIIHKANTKRHCHCGLTSGGVNFCFTIKEFGIESFLYFACKRCHLYGIFLIIR